MAGAGNPLLPVQPFAEWLKKKAAFYALFEDPNGGNLGYQTLARHTGMSDRQIRRYINGGAERVTLTTVDDALTREGSTMLWELYP